jgi:hypothetical protein
MKLFISMVQKLQNEKIRRTDLKKLHKKITLFSTVVIRNK